MPTPTHHADFARHEADRPAVDVRVTGEYGSGTPARLDHPPSA